MTEYNKLYILRFYYHYLLVLTVITSLFFWFQGDIASFLFAGLLLVLPSVFLFRLKREKEEKMPNCHPGFLVVVAMVATPGTIVYEGDPNVYFCLFFYTLAAVAVIANGYIKRRYYVLYCNPSVSEETRVLAGKLQKKTLWRIGLFAGIGMLAFVIFFMSMPETQPQKQEKKITQEEKKKMESFQRTEKKSAVQKKIQEENEKAAANFWLLLLRYISLIVLVFLAGLVVVYGIVCFIRYLLRRKKDVIIEYEEQREKMTSFQEVISLVPRVRNKEVFSKGRSGQIRKAFYQYVKIGAGKERVDDTLSPREMNQRYMQDGNRERFLIHLYEKVRYTKNELSEEEWEQWQKMRKEK